MTSRCAALCLVAALATNVGCDSSSEGDVSTSDAGVDTGDLRASCPESCCCPDIFDGAVARGPCPAGFIFYCDECPLQLACQRHGDASPPAADASDAGIDVDADADLDAETSADGGDADDGER